MLTQTMYKEDDIIVEATNISTVKIDATSACVKHLINN